MTETTDPCRAAFEAWARTTGFSLDPRLDRYGVWGTWQTAWQAATAASAAPQSAHIEAWTWFDGSGEYHLTRDEPLERETVLQLTALVAASTSVSAAPLPSRNIKETA